MSKGDENVTSIQWVYQLCVAISLWVCPVPRGSTHTFPWVPSLLPRLTHQVVGLQWTPQKLQQRIFMEMNCHVPTSLFEYFLYTLLTPTLGWRYRLTVGIITLVSTTYRIIHTLTYEVVTYSWKFNTVLQILRKAGLEFRSQDWTRSNKFTSCRRTSRLQVSSRGLDTFAWCSPAQERDNQPSHTVTYPQWVNIIYQLNWKEV